VSAIVTVFNYGDYITRTLDSALAQDYPAHLLECVVVDDGSTDHTPDVLADLARRHPGRVRVIRQENAGYVAATNRALREARGDVLAILDADDLWPRTKTRDQVQVLLDRPEVGLVYSDTQVIDPYDTVVRPSLWEWYKMEPLRGPDAFARIMGAPGNPALASTIVFRRSLLEHVAPIPLGAPYVDWWVTARAAQVAELEFLADTKVGYRFHGENLTLGAQGHQRVREQIKIAEIRRQLLMRGAVDDLGDRELLLAWRAFEKAGVTAVSMAGSAYLPLPPVGQEEAKTAAWLADETREAIVDGRWDEALRLAVRTIAHDPYGGQAREWVGELGPAVLNARADLEAPLAETRPFLTVAFISELVAEPQLLLAYAEAFAGVEHATLAIEAVGVEPAQALERLRDVLAAGGLDEHALPDTLVVIEDVPGMKLELERRADALLTRRKPRLAARAFAPERIEQLRELAGAALVAA
jgi:hypothetical protein